MAGDDTDRIAGLRALLGDGHVGLQGVGELLELGQALTVEEQMTVLEYARLLLVDGVAMAVTRARTEGWSWSQIAARLQLSRQAAWDRFKDEAPLIEHLSLL